MVIGPAGVEDLSVLGPGHGGAAESLGGVALVLLHGGGGDLLLDELLLGEVEDLDAGLGGDNEPVELLGEEDGVDGGVAVVLGEPLAVDNVPDHDGAITGAGGEEGGVLNDIEGGNLSLVATEGVEEGHVEVIPDLDGLIPRGGDTKSGLLGVVETHNGDGIGMVVLVNGELALRAGVPDLDVAIEGTSDDLTIVGGEGDGENVSLVTNELGDGAASGNVPETHGTVPGGGEGEAGVTGELDLGDEVRVTGHELAGDAPLLVLVLILGRGKVPLDEGLITGSRHEELHALAINLLFADGERGDPTAMASHVTAVAETVLSFAFFCHLCNVFCFRFIND